MKILYWIVPVLALVCCVGCSKNKTVYEGNWVDTYSETTLNIKGNQIVIGFGEWKDTYKFKIKKEGEQVFLMNVKGDGSFDLMTELNVCEDGSLLAYPMVLDAEVSPYRFVREEVKEAGMQVQDFSEDLPKEIFSTELNYFSLNFDYEDVYGLSEEWPTGSYHWTIEKLDDGTFDFCFQVYQDSYMSINYHELVTEAYVLGLIETLKTSGVFENNGYHMENKESLKEYTLVANFGSGEYIKICAKGKPAETCVFDLQRLLDYAKTLDLLYN